MADAYIGEIRLQKYICKIAESVEEHKFALEPHDRTAVMGENVELPCRVLNRVGTLQWTRDEFALGDDRKLQGYPRYSMRGIEEEGEYSLRIERVNLLDDAVFQCQVGASPGVKGIRSRSAKLTVLVDNASVKHKISHELRNSSRDYRFASRFHPDAPMIVQGTHMKTTAGVTIELVCEAHGGKPAAELSWLDGDGVKITSGIQNEKKKLSDGKRWNSISKLTIKPTAEHNGKRFTCRSENSALVQPQSTFIDLEVKYPPDVVLSVDKEVINEFNDVEFKCESKANPNNVLYKWFKNDEVVVGDFQETYTISKITRDYNGATISCEVSNKVGITKTSYTLDVFYPPTVKSKIENIAAEEGKEVTLKCDVDGNPEPEIIWTHEGSEKILGVGKDLVIKNLTREHTGRYTCRAVARGFKEVTVHSLLFVKGPPKVHSEKIQYGVKGKAVKIECLAYSVPAPIKMNWTRNNQPLDLSNKRFEIVEDSLADGIRQVLVIKNAKDEDFTGYNCSVMNEYGIDVMQIQLHKQNPAMGKTPAFISYHIIAICTPKYDSIRPKMSLLYQQKSQSRWTPSLPMGSDMKVEVHTNSSLSHNDTTTDHWENTSDETQTGKTNDIYRYSNDYTDPMYPLKSVSIDENH
ncbi:Irregular chiasm C-roughest protein [Nymphon striatum]|nr:Irregular chiasm C-roughest protein [Nymphon striatum]